MTPSRRPPWWPEDETWPPHGRGPRGPWMAGRHRRAARGFGCLFGLVFLAMFGLAVAFVALVAQLLVLVGGGGLDPLLVAAVLILIGAIGAFAGAGGGFRRSTRTLDTLVDATARVEAGDYSVRVPERERTPRPIRELVSGFNTMADRLEFDERQRRSLLADVSHELRTPLAVIQGGIEAMIDGIHPADDAHLGAILDETRVLSRLVEDVRTVALSEAGTLALHREATDLEVLLGDVAASFGTLAAAGGIRLALAVDGDLPLLEVDPVRIREVLSNLVANALRYSHRDGRIELAGELERGGSWVRLTVSDSGTGIAPEALPHVFDRFTKSSDSRGSGLGLAIARSLVEAHGGSIEAASGSRAGVDGRPGTTFTVRLPATAVE